MLYTEWGRWEELEPGRRKKDFYATGTVRANSGGQRNAHKSLTKVAKIPKTAYFRGREANRPDEHTVYTHANKAIAFGLDGFGCAIETCINSREPPK